MTRRRSHRGFTLIEVLIVVAVMAVLAGMILPQLGSSTADAKTSALEFDLRVMRAQIELYAVHHLGVYPPLQDNDLPQLTHPTDANGNIGPGGDAFPFGPYIASGKLPENPFDGSNKVTAVAVAGKKPTRPVGNLGGWQYDETNGAIWPNHAGYYSKALADRIEVAPRGLGVPSPSP
jgi:general secretion pathway protein G